ncbi:MAG: chemotaxis protein [Desulfobacterales bacterium]|nr:chemotaxis protein [Desulfobacterales bacterium]
MNTQANLQETKGILLESGTNEMELLTVMVGNQIFGMNVAKVQSIQQYDPKLVTALPEPAEGILGMFLYRNKTIPLMDLSQLLGIEENNELSREIVVVTEFNNAVNSFKVQGVNRIYRLSWKEFVPLDQLFENSAFFTGSVHVDDTQVLVIDLEHILAGIFPDQILEEVSEEILTQKEPVDRSELKIYFAEDSPTMRRGVVGKLKEAGYSDLKDFENGELAYQYIRANYKTVAKDQPTFLVTDIEMPKMDGLTLCRKIKQDPVLQDIYVVMFSSLINKQMVAKCQKVRADNYVTKPEINELIKILDQ